MTTGNGVPAQAPLYVRVLRLRQLRVGGFLSFLLFECMIAIGVLLALAELVSWWAIPILPAAVAVMVKINDVVAGPRNRRRELESARVVADEKQPATAGKLPAVAGKQAAFASKGAGAGGAPERGRAAGGRGAAGSPGQGRSTQQPGSRERVESGEDGSKGGDAVQRRPIGVIRIAVPPRDGGVGRTTTAGAQRGATAAAQRGAATTGAPQGTASVGGPRATAGTGPGGDAGTGDHRAATTAGQQRGPAPAAAQDEAHNGTSAPARGAPEHGGRSGGNGARTHNGAESGGRHARVQRTGGGGRYTDDGYVSNGRHSDSMHRGDEEITRQRGTLNQGRFA